MHRFLLTLLIATSAFSASAQPELDLASDFPTAYHELRNFYGNDLPLGIKVHFRDFADGNSKFNCETNTIFVNRNLNGPKRLHTVLVHEGSHLALCGVTRKFNLELSSRFWDEGLATLLEARANESAAKYRERCMRLAREQQKLGRLSLSQLEDWYRFSRDENGKINSYAYGVGSSFIFFLIETFGNSALRKFLADLGTTRNFATSALHTFNVSTAELEEKWLRFIGNPKASVTSDGQ